MKEKLSLLKILMESREKAKLNQKGLWEYVLLYFSLNKLFIQR